MQQHALSEVGPHVPLYTYMTKIDAEPVEHCHKVVLHELLRI